MDSIYIAKKSAQSSPTMAAEVHFKDSYIEVKSAEKTIRQILETLHKRMAWKDISKIKGVIMKVPIIDKEKAFDYNIKNRLPAPYFIERKPWPSIKKMAYTDYLKKK